MQPNAESADRPPGQRQDKLEARTHRRSRRRRPGPRYAEKLRLKASAARGSRGLFSIVQNSAYCQLCRIRHSWHSCAHLKACADDAFGKGQRGRRCVVREIPRHSARRSEGHRQDHRGDPPSGALGPGRRGSRAGAQVLPQEPEADGLQGGERRRLQHRLRRGGVLEQESCAAEAEALRPALGTRGRPVGPELPLAGEVRAVRRRLPQPAAASAGDCTCQAPGRRSAAGTGRVIRNAGIPTAKSPPCEIHTLAIAALTGMPYSMRHHSIPQGTRQRFRQHAILGCPLQMLFRSATCY